MNVNNLAYFTFKIIMIIFLDSLVGDNMVGLWSTYPLGSLDVQSSPGNSNMAVHINSKFIKRIFDDLYMYPAYLFVDPRSLASIRAL